MYERFTDRARKVMQLANQEAQRFNHEYIGTEHLLLGVIKEGGGVAANVLKNLDVDLRKIRLGVEKLVQSGPDMVTMGKLPQTPRAKKVIEYSMEEVRNLNHNYLGTEHILLGLLRVQEGVAAQVLMDFGLKLEEVREEVLNLLGHGVEEPSGERADRSRWKDLVRQHGEDPRAKPLLQMMTLFEREKAEAVEAQDFERAAALRDRADKLRRKCRVLLENISSEAGSHPRTSDWIGCLCQSVGLPDGEPLRSGEINRAMEHLLRSQMVLVVGPAGSGRTSFVQFVAREMYFASLKVDPVPRTLVKPQHLSIKHAAEKTDYLDVLMKLSDDLRYRQTIGLAVPNMEQYCNADCTAPEIVDAWKQVFRQASEADFMMIVTTTPEGEEALRANWPGLLSRCIRMPLSELPDSELLRLIHSRISQYTQRRNLSFDEGVARAIVARRGDWPDTEETDPGRVLDLLDHVVGAAQQGAADEPSVEEHSAFETRRSLQQDAGIMMARRMYRAAESVVRQLSILADQRKPPKRLPTMRVTTTHVYELLENRQCH